MLSDSALVAGPALYVPVRAVAPPDSPFEGVLARAPGGRTVLMVDRARLAGWPGWDADGHDHLLAPLDVLRRADGHDVVLPMMTERLDRLIARRAHAQVPPTDGEAVTVAVSVVRGLVAALQASRAAECAQWWLTDDARPVMVEGHGDADPRRASALVLQALADAMTHSAVRAHITQVATTMADERMQARTLTGWEDDLFSLCAPEPLAIDVMSPRRPPATAGESDGEYAAPPEDDPRSWARRLSGHLDAELSDTVSDALTRFRRALGRLRTGRRRPVLLAGALALAVITVGLAWPDGKPPAEARPTDPAPADPSTAADTAASRPPVETAAPDPDPAVAATPVDALAALLDARVACADESCRARGLEDPTRALAAGAIDLEASERSIRLVDDLGGLVVLAVESPTDAATAQLVTLVQQEDEWRIRDAYSVADPPS